MGSTCLGFPLVGALLLALFVLGIGFPPPSLPTSDRRIWIPTDLLSNVEEVTAGITDATSFAADERPKVIIDWKSDADPSAETVGHYRAQVRSYLWTMGIANAKIIFINSELSCQ